MPLQVSDFAYDLPRELIAQNPVIPRDSARLLVYTRATGKLQHAHVRDLPSFLSEPGVIVANNSLVRHCRLHAKREYKKEVEILVLEHRLDRAYLCLLRGRNLKIGEVLTLETGVTATIMSIEEHFGIHTYLVSFSLPAQEFEVFLDMYGEMPLPPYITRSHATPEQYQTIFARELGSAAAPTAGLHITPELIQRLKEAGQTWEEVTLHVGMGTFLPLREATLAKNRLHQEYLSISPKTAAVLTAARQTKQRILAIGTTTTRTLESQSTPSLVPGTTTTDLFIYPPYAFKTVSALLTNFHLPNSSLLALVTAFIQNDSTGSLYCSVEEALTHLHRIYDCAIQERYRFFSFGDAMLVL